MGSHPKERGWCELYLIATVLIGLSANITKVVWSLPVPLKRHSNWLHARTLTVSELPQGRPRSASPAAVPAVAAGHRCICGPFRARLQRSTDSEFITRRSTEPQLPYPHGSGPGSRGRGQESCGSTYGYLYTYLQPVLQHGRINSLINVQMLTPPHWL